MTRKQEIPLSPLQRTENGVTTFVRPIPPPARGGWLTPAPVVDGFYERQARAWAWTEGRRLTPAQATARDRALRRSAEQRAVRRARHAPPRDPDKLRDETMERSAALGATRSRFGVPRREPSELSASADAIAREQAIREGRIKLARAKAEAAIGESKGRGDSQKRPWPTSPMGRKTPGPPKTLPMNRAQLEVFERTTDAETDEVQALIADLERGYAADGKFNVTRWNRAQAMLDTQIERLEALGVDTTESRRLQGQAALKFGELIAASQR